MSTPCNYILQMAHKIWDDIGQPTAVSPQYIASWLMASHNLGQLNNAINTCFVNTSGVIDPVMGGDEQSIYRNLYLISYYGRQASAFLGAASTDSWLELKDDVSSIKRQNKNEISKSFIALQKQTQDELKDRIFSYERNRAGIGYVGMGEGEEIIYTDEVNNRDTNEL